MWGGEWGRLSSVREHGEHVPAHTFTHAHALRTLPREGDIGPILSLKAELALHYTLPPDIEKCTDTTGVLHLKKAAMGGRRSDNLSGG